jgi:hypothetical protein
MKTGSIRISKNGNQIHLTGDFANDFFKAAQKDHESKQAARHTHVNNGVNDNCKECGRDLRHEVHLRIDAPTNPL